MNFIKNQPLSTVVMLGMLVILLAFVLFALLKHAYRKYKYRYYEYILSPTSNGKEKVIIVTFQLLICYGVYSVVNVFGIANYFSSESLTNKLVLVFGMLSVYAIIFSISQFMISSKKDPKKYWAVNIDGRPRDIVILEEIEQSFLFRINLIVFILAPVFWSVFPFEIKNIWTMSLILLAIVIFLNLTWGYSSMRQMNRGDRSWIEKNEHQIIEGELRSG